jgi:hypothetical protein
MSEPCSNFANYLSNQARFSTKERSFLFREKNSDRCPQVGIVNFSQKRSVKTSYTVWQWFSQQAIAHDVLPITQLKAETLVAAQSDVKQLGKLVQTEQWVK